MPTGSRRRFPLAATVRPARRPVAEPNKRHLLQCDIARPHVETLARVPRPYHSQAGWLRLERSNSFRKQTCLMTQACRRCCSFFNQRSVLLGRGVQLLHRTVDL